MSSRQYNRRLRASGHNVNSRPHAADIDMVEALLEQDSFRVRTVDARNWINPYTGERVPTPFDFEPAVTEFLLAQRPWDKHHPMTFHQVLTIKWTTFIKRSIKHDERLRIFHPDGRWLNPFIGAWVDNIPRKDRRVGSITLKAMAEALALCAKTQGCDDLLPMDQLQRIVQDTLQQQRQTRTIAGPSATVATQQQLTTVQSLSRVSTDGTRAWANLFDSDSPFDETEAQQQRSRLQQMSDAVHVIIRNSGIDWAMHPGFEQNKGGVIFELIPIGDNQVFMLVGDLPNVGADAADVVVESLVQLLRHACQTQTAFSNLLQQLNDFLHAQLGPGHEMTGITCLFNSNTRVLESAAFASRPVYAITPDDPNRVQSIGSAMPALGTVPWSDMKRSWNPGALHLQTGTRIMLAHHRLFVVNNDQGVSFDVKTALNAMYQLRYDKPGKTIRRLLELVKQHTGKPLRRCLPYSGLLVMHVRR